MVDRLVGQGRRIARGSPTRSRRRCGPPKASSKSCATPAGKRTDVLGALRLPRVRALAPRTRAAAVLVQLAVRRVPGMSRRRNRARCRRPSWCSAIRRSRFSRAWCCRGASRAATCARSCCRPWPARSSSTSTAPWGDLPAAARKVLLSRRTRKEAQVTPPMAGAGAKSRATGKASSPTCRAAIASRAATRCASDLEGYMVEQPCPVVRRQAPAPESLSVMVAGRSIGDVVDMPVDDAVDVLPADSGRARKAGRGRSRHRRADSQGSHRAAGLPARRRAGIPHPRSLGRHAVGRRGAAHPPRHADRIAPGGRALHSRRAEHRSAPARQRAAARYAARPARSRQHGDRRRARRGHHSRRRSRRSTSGRAPAGLAARWWSRAPSRK